MPRRPMPQKCRTVAARLCRLDAGPTGRWSLRSGLVDALAWVGPEVAACGDAATVPAAHGESIEIFGLSSRKSFVGRGRGDSPGSYAANSRASASSRRSSRAAGGSPARHVVRTHPCTKPVGLSRLRLSHREPAVPDSRSAQHQTSMPYLTCIGPHGRNRENVSGFASRGYWVFRRGRTVFARFGEVITVRGRRLHQVLAVYPNWTRHFGKCRLAFQRRIVQWKRIAGGQTDGGALRPSSSASRSRACSVAKSRWRS